MRTQIYDINLVVGAGIPPIVKVSQYDELRVLAFRLFDGIREYFPFENEEVTITGTKPSGLGFTEECSINGSLATVETTLAMTQESGRINAELRISDGSTNIGTANFILYVEPSPHPEGTTDGTTEEARTVLEQCEYYAGVAQDAASAASADYTQLSAEIGTLSELTTTAKSSAVAAINEVNSGLSDVKADLEDLDERVEALESGGGGSGLTEGVKAALLQLAQKVAYIDDDGQDYYDDLYNALYPPADLVSISAVYTQSGTVYDTNSLESLKSDLVVTAHKSDSTTQTVTNYTLSGTLTAGTSTITVTYGGKSTTFNVTVSRDPSTLVNTVTGVTPLISIGDITLTSGMINDNGEIVSQSNTYLYNEYVDGSVFTILDSTYAVKTGITNYRTAGYNSSKAFLGRNYKNAVGGGFYTDAAYIKMGYTGTTTSTDYFINLPYSLNGICSIDNTRILDTGEESSNSSYMASDYIPISTTGVGAISCTTGTSMVVGVAFYDSSKTFISYFNATTGSPAKYVCPFEITSSMKYCRFTVKKTATADTSLVIQEV